MRNVKRKNRQEKSFIFLNGFHVPARVGCTIEERACEQDVVVDLKVHLSLDKAATSDDLRDTLDYALLAEEIKKMAREKEFVLLETMADSIIQIALQDPRVALVEVSLGKKVLPGVELCGVSMQRRRQ